MSSFQIQQRFAPESYKGDTNPGSIRFFYITIVSLYR